MPTIEERLETLATAHKAVTDAAHQLLYSDEFAQYRADDEAARCQAAYDDRNYNWNGHTTVQENEALLAAASTDLDNISELLIED